MSSEIAAFDLPKVATPLGIFALNHHPYYYDSIIYDRVPGERSPFPRLDVRPFGSQSEIRIRKNVSAARRDREYIGAI